MFAEQKERNPKAKFTKTKTLDWFYVTEQIKHRIAQYKGVMAYTPRTKIRQTEQVQDKKYLRNYIDRSNMKLASIAYIRNFMNNYSFFSMILRLF